MVNMKTVVGIMAVLMAPTFALVGCGSDSKSPPCTTCSNIAGTWDTVENVSASACGSASTEHNTYTVTQSGCTLTVVPSGSATSFNGSICDKTLSWTGSYPEGSGTTTITSMSVTLNDSSTPNTMSGTANWTWRGTSSSCSGSTATTGTKR